MFALPQQYYNFDPLPLKSLVALFLTGWLFLALAVILTYVPASGCKVYIPK